MKHNFTELLIILDSAHNALTAHNNFNLAKAHLYEYFQELPQKILDAKSAAHLHHGLKQRNTELLLAAIEEEQERLQLIKIKKLQNSLAQTNLKKYKNY